VKALTTIEIHAGELPAWKCRRIVNDDNTPVLLMECEESTVGIVGQPDDIRLFAQSLDQIAALAGKGVMQ